MTEQTGIFKTAHASKYLQQMCKHFAHKVDVTFDETHGEAQLPSGTALFDANKDRLSVSITGKTDDERAQARHVIDVHLQKFAFREAFEAMNWDEPERA
ncbi:MAG: DUF2218 domain-containing protein [Cognatishimia sp.]